MTLILDLPNNKEAALKAKAQAQGLSAEQYVQGIVDLDLQDVTMPVATIPRRHISEVIREIMSDVPLEDFAGLPRDGASEHYHYLYGSPKKNQ